MIPKDQLKGLGEKGWIPGPDESEEAFVKRINKGSRIQGKNVSDYSETLALSPDWIPLNYSNKKLLPWQGAVMWVSKDAEGIQFPSIQLRKGFLKGRFWGTEKGEVLMHETVHAVRVMFSEPRFEEILAYYHSPKKWRGYLAPLFRTPGQALFFLSMVLISIGFQFGSLFFIEHHLLPIVQWVSLLPLLDLALRFSALIRDRRIFKKCLRKLSHIFSDSKRAFAIALRLKDSEIEEFAVEPIEKLLNRIEKKVPQSLRWRQILAQFC